MGSLAGASASKPRSKVGHFVALIAKRPRGTLFADRPLRVAIDGHIRDVSWASSVRTTRPRDEGSSYLLRRRGDIEMQERLSC
jgi:hypothetical protein